MSVKAKISFYSFLQSYASHIRSFWVFLRIHTDGTDENKALTARLVNGF